MPTAIEHAEVVLSAIIPSRPDLMDRALRQLVPGHFQDATHRAMFQMLERYYEFTGAIMTRPALGDLLRGQVEGTRVLLYEEQYDKFAARAVEDSDFVHSVLQMRELEAERATVSALTEGMEAVRTGLTVGRDFRHGHQDARLLVMERFADIDRELSMQDSPEGDMRTEGSDMAADYAERRELHLTGKAKGVLFGIGELDRKVNGIQNGELCLMAGYSSDGKTTMCVQLAWSACVEQGLNVVFLTTETLRPQVRRKIIARHSVLPQFGLPDGLNTRDLKNGTLSEEEQAKLVDEVIPDFTQNPAYGRLEIIQIPRNSTVGTLESKLHRIQRKFNVELVIMDYLRLLRAERNRSSDREELGAIIVESKQLATTFDNGRGVPFVSPWQVNRSARDEAERLGYYSSKALAETAEATNTSDVIATILAPTDNEQRKTEVKLQLVKNRDGEKANSLAVRVDYATSTFTSLSREAGMEQLLGDDTSDPSGSEYASLLGG